MIRDTRWTPAEEVVLLAMCKEHDREEAAQRGEPSPWDAEGEDYDEFREERLHAMYEAFEIAKAYFSNGASNER
jgi:hypothetical protein